MRVREVRDRETQPKANYNMIIIFHNQCRSSEVCIPCLHCNLTLATALRTPSLVSLHLMSIAWNPGSSQASLFTASCRRSGSNSGTDLARFLYLRNMLLVLLCFNTDLSLFLNEQALSFKCLNSVFI